MPYRGDVFGCGCYYHLFNRGVGRGPVFFGDANYAYCLRLVSRYAQPFGARIVAYCLMPNHYHLLVRQETDQPLSRFMGAVFNAYVQAVNRQQVRTGTLFEGRFRHILVGRDEYVAQLCRYIHLNPVKGGLAARPEEWPYSDYREWVGLRPWVFGDEAFIHRFWATADEYRRFVMEDSQDSAIDDYILE